MLISAETLYERLQTGDVTVFDCRFSLSDVTAGRRAYGEGHIPSAYYLNLDTDLSGPKGHGGGRHPLPAPDELATKLSQCGVTKEKTVVAYDAGEGMAARAWWLLRFLGHKNVHLLDGGLAAWLQAGYELETTPPQPHPAVFEPDVQWDMVMPLEQVADISSGRQTGTLVDARAASRYRGENETMDPQGGHIPSAKNAPWQEGVGPDGKWLDESQQRTRFEHWREEGAPLVMYCGSGVTACNNLFALELAGIHGAKLYPGSWSEWSANSNRPIATDDEV
jgi:thiosulfate/3-mercaptopyruvate sulfurtransferase